MTGSVESSLFLSPGTSSLVNEPMDKAAEAPGLEVTLGLSKWIQCNKGMGPEHN